MGRESKSEAHDERGRSSCLPRMRLIAVAVSGSIGDVGDAGGSETRPYWRIGVEEVACAPRTGKPGVTKRRQADLGLCSGQALRLRSGQSRTP